MCIPNRIKKYIAEKEVLDLKIAQLEKLEAATAPVKNLLTKLLADYSQEAPEEVSDIWEEVLAIGQKFNLAVPPIATEDLREWEAANQERDILRSKLCNYEIERDKLKRELEEVRSQLAQMQATYLNPNPSPELTPGESAEVATRLEDWGEELQRQKDGEEKEVASEMVGWRQEHEEELTGQAYDDAVEEELSLDDEKANIIPALTLHQPWATLTAEGVKQIETRSWQTSYRGPLAIHAAKKSVSISDCPELFDLLPDNCEFPLGAVVAIADLVDCVEMTPELIAQQSDREILCGDWQPGRFAWILKNVRPLVQSIPAAGKQGLWKWQSEGLSAAEPEVEKVEVVEDAIEDILACHGFFLRDIKSEDCYDEDEKYEDYRNWAIYYGNSNGGIVAIGLFNAEYNQFWNASTEYIREIDSTFPKSLDDYHEILVWTRAAIDRVENLQVPGQLSLFPEAIPEKIEGMTKPQKLLADNSSFTFEDLGTTVTVESVIAPADDIVGFASEEALITVSDGEYNRAYYVDAQTFTHQHKDVREAALGYAQHFLADLKNAAQIKEKVARWTAETTSDTVEKIAANPETETRFEVMGYKVQVYSCILEENFMGATFRFLNSEHTLVFSENLKKDQIGDRSFQECARDLIQDWQNKEVKKKEGMEKPHKEAESDFIELIKLSPSVAYLKQKKGKDEGKILATYVAFANKDAQGKRTPTNSKPRAQKWRDYFHSTFETCGWQVGEVRNADRMKGEPGKPGPSYEIKIVGASMGQIEKLLEYDFSLLPDEIGKEAVKPVAQPAPTHTVKVNDHWLAAGSEEEMKARFEEELHLLGMACTSVAFLAGEEILESFAVSDFEFEKVENFDLGNPEYEVLHLPSEERFTVWKKPTVGQQDTWRNSVYPYANNFLYREGAAADAVRRSLKRKNAKAD